MKVKDVIRGLLDKEPDDDVMVSVEVKLVINNQCVSSLRSDVPVDGIVSGSWPVMLTAETVVAVKSEVVTY